jgi:hypothetical protein
VASYDRALAVNADDHVAASNRAYEFLQLAEFEAEAGADVSARLDQSERSLARSLAVNPRYFNGLMFQGDLARLRAELRLRNDRSPATDLARGRTAYEAALQLNETSADALYRLGRLQVLTAVAARRQGLEPVGALDSAEATCRRVQAINVDYAAAHALRGEIARLRLAWGLVPPGAEAGARADGLAAVNRALDINPRLTRARWAKAGLLTDRAAAAALLDTVRSERPGLDESLRRLYGLE